MGAGPTQRCWMERQQVPTGSSQPNVGGAVAGALIGGILGHQIGGGSGRDAATGLGVVAGAAIGANAGNNNSGYAVQDVQRCDTPVSGTPAYWDVTYNFRGMEHRLQMAAPPGSTIVVNDSGQPRQ